MKRRMKRFAEGGVGYEEDPKPGKQTKTIEVKRSKPSDRKASPRKISSMEFIQKYESEAPSSRMREEAEAAIKKSRQMLPGDRATNFKEQRGIARGTMDLDQEDVDRSLGTMGKIAAAAAGAGAAKAQLPLRAKQLLRRMQTARANAAERVTDKAGEAARRGMSRRNAPRYDERYRAGESGAQSRRDLEDAALSGGMYRRGGSVKSSASKRGDGIAMKGKTRGKFI